MTQPNEGLRVTLASNGIHPVSLHWQDHTVRVLRVEEVRTRGPERSYRVRTIEGPYEIGQRIGTGAWQMRRAPNWLERARARLQRMPRYPLPAGRRRNRKAAPATETQGGQHANRLALVRQ
jgi:hypothetical protein